LLTTLKSNLLHLLGHYRGERKEAKTGRPPGQAPEDASAQAGH